MLTVMNKADLLAGSAQELERTLPEIANDPDARAHEVLHDDPRPDREGVTAGRHALFSRTMRSGALISPRLGEHTREVLAEIGYADGQIDNLIGSGAALEASPP